MASGNGTRSSTHHQENAASDNVPRCLDCGSVRIFVHPTKVRTTLKAHIIESRVTCADCKSFQTLNEHP